MSTTGLIVRLQQILLLVPLAETPSTGDLPKKRDFINIDSVIDQCYLHLLPQVKRWVDVLDKVCELVHTGEPSVLVFSLFPSSIYRTTGWDTNFWLAALDNFNVNVRTEVLEALPEVFDIIVGTSGCFEPLQNKLV